MKNLWIYSLLACSLNACSLKCLFPCYYKNQEGSGAGEVESQEHTPVATGTELNIPDEARPPTESGMPEQNRDETSSTPGLESDNVVEPVDPEAIPTPEPSNVNDFLSNYLIKPIAAIVYSNDLSEYMDRKLSRLLSDNLGLLDTQNSFVFNSGSMSVNVLILIAQWHINFNYGAHTCSLDVINNGLEKVFKETSKYATILAVGYDPTDQKPFLILIRGGASKKMELVGSISVTLPGYNHEKRTGFYDIRSWDPKVYIDVSRIKTTSDFGVAKQCLADLIEQYTMTDNRMESSLILGLTESEDCSRIIKPAGLSRDGIACGLNYIDRFFSWTEDGKVDCYNLCNGTICGYSKLDLGVILDKLKHFGVEKITQGRYAIIDEEEFDMMSHWSLEKRGLEFTDSEPEPGSIAIIEDTEGCFPCVCLGKQLISYISPTFNYNCAEKVLIKFMPSVEIQKTHFKPNKIWLKNRQKARQRQKARRSRKN